MRVVFCFTSLSAILNHAFVGYDSVSCKLLLLLSLAFL